ncbi:MAG TPA: PilZ domain-containing protein [Verrucomicrobiae bacterium]|nr:PilZ domain-containing protein [Verrucomicrobiae bacterium]
MSLSTSKSANFGGLPERRGTSRFPVREDVRYRVMHSKSGMISGSGTTLNIGSGGILFTTEDRLPVGRTVELSVNWPARLDGTCPLQFVATGRVVRSDQNRAAVRIERYEFKTRSANGCPAGAGVSCMTYQQTEP